MPLLLLGTKLFLPVGYVDVVVNKFNFLTIHLFDNHLWSRNILLLGSSLKLANFRNTGIQHFWEECKLNSLMTGSTRGVRNRFQQAASQWSCCKKAIVKSQCYSQAWHWGLQKLSTNLSIDLIEINVFCYKVGWFIMTIGIVNVLNLTAFNRLSLQFSSTCWEFRGSHASPAVQ